MNRLHALIQRVRNDKSPVAAPKELPVLTPADMKQVAGGLPYVNGFLMAPPAPDAKTAA